MILLRLRRVTSFGDRDVHSALLYVDVTPHALWLAKPCEVQGDEPTEQSHFKPLQVHLMILTLASMSPYSC